MRSYHLRKFTTIEIALLEISEIVVGEIVAVINAVVARMTSYEGGWS